MRPRSALSNRENTMANLPPRQMALVGFMQASNVSVYAGSWLHPDSSPDFLSAGYYQHIGRVLEAGCFDMLFFDDRLAMPGIFGNSVAETVRAGASADSPKDTSSASDASGCEYSSLAFGPVTLRATTASPAPGEHRVVDATAIEAVVPTARPDVFSPGRQLPVRVMVNGIPSKPGPRLAVA